MRSSLPALSVKIARHAPRARELGAYAVQPGEVVAHLLEGHQVEPVDDLGDQGVVARLAGLGAEVGEVPRGEEQAVVVPPWNLAAGLVVAVVPQGTFFGGEGEGVGEAWFGKDGREGPPGSQRSPGVNGAMHSGASLRGLLTRRLTG